MQEVKLSDIEITPPDQLKPERLQTLQHGHLPFEQVLVSKTDPIALDLKSGKPYQITDGRHRIHLARQKGLKTVMVKWV